MSNTYTKGYSNGTALTESMLDTAYQSLQLDIANTALTTTGSTTGQGLLSNGSGVAASFQTIPDPMGPFALRNYGLKATVATGVMTVSLKTKAGTAPSGTDIVDFNYSTNGTTSAAYSSIQVTTATTLAINASASLGYTATSTSRIFVYGYYNSSAVAVKLAVSARSDFDGVGSIATTAMAASADNKMVLYASAALTVVPRLLGHIDAAHNSGGSWQTPTKVNIENVSPGQRGIVVSTAASGAYTTTSASFVDVTGLSVAITTSGRPVRLELIPDSTAAVGDAYLYSSKTSGTIGTSEFQFIRGTSSLGIMAIVIQGVSGTLTGSNAPGSMTTIDFPAAGTYTYKFQARINTATTAGVANVKLLAYEL